MANRQDLFPLIEVLRNGFVESFHLGSAIIVDSDGTIIKGWGDYEMLIFPRSAVKMIQSLPLIESGALKSLGLGKEVTVEALNDFLRQKAFHSDLKEQIGFTNSPEVVSTDFVSDSHAGIVDSAATIVNGNKCTLYVWYDNEYGYTAQLLGLAKEMVGLTYKRYPNFS